MMMSRATNVDVTFPRRLSERANERAWRGRRLGGVSVRALSLSCKFTCARPLRCCTHDTHKHTNTNSARAPPLPRSTSLLSLFASPRAENKSGDIARKKRRKRMPANSPKPPPPGSTRHRHASHSLSSAHPPPPPTLQENRAKKKRARPSLSATLALALPLVVAPLRAASQVLVVAPGTNVQVDWRNNNNGNSGRCGAHASWLQHWGHCSGGQFHATLSGDKVVPAKIDTAATGHAWACLTHDKQTLVTHLVLCSLSNYVASHYHFGGPSIDLPPPLLALEPSQKPSDPLAPPAELPQLSPPLDIGGGSDDNNDYYWHWQQPQLPRGSGHPPDFRPYRRAWWARDVGRLCCGHAARRGVFERSHSDAPGRRDPGQPGGVLRRGVGFSSCTEKTRTWHRFLR